jgi:hypothetical protein
MKVKKRLPTYYKTECLDCEIIMSVRWERTYLGALPTTFQHPTQQKNCPFCQGIRIKIAKINEQEYLRINQQWDMIDLTGTGNNNLGLSCQCRDENAGFF